MPLTMRPAGSSLPYPHTRTWPLPPFALLLRANFRMARAWRRIGSGISGARRAPLAQGAADWLRLAHRYAGGLHRGSCPLKEKRAPGMTGERA
jgi:hypothetical protein